MTWLISTINICTLAVRLCLFPCTLYGVKHAFFWWSHTHTCVKSHSNIRAAVMLYSEQAGRQHWYLYLCLPTRKHTIWRYSKLVKPRQNAWLEPIFTYWFYLLSPLFQRGSSCLDVAKENVKKYLREHWAECFHEESVKSLQDSKKRKWQAVWSGMHCGTVSTVRGLHIGQMWIRIYLYVYVFVCMHFFCCSSAVQMALWRDATLSMTSWCQWV